MENMIRDLFFDCIFEDNIYIEGNPTKKPTQYVSVGVFCNLFLEAESNFSINELIRIDEENEYGYKEFFEQFKSQ